MVQEAPPEEIATSQAETQSSTRYVRNSLLYVLPSMLPCTWNFRGHFRELPAELKFRFFIFTNISKYTVLRRCVIKSRHVIVRTTTHKVLCWLMCRCQQLVVATSWNEQHLNSSCWVGMVKKGATLRLQVVYKPNDLKSCIFLN